MALRGDSIDNIPGAPGIGDKGSVDLIKQFGTVEAALDRAEEVKKKDLSRVAREQSRQHPALERACHDPHRRADRVQPRRHAHPAGRQRRLPRSCFTELEFTTLLKELAALDVDDTASHLQPPTHFRRSRELCSKPTLPGSQPSQSHPELGCIAAWLSRSSKTPAPSRKMIAAEPTPNPSNRNLPPAENLSLFGVRGTRGNIRVANL